MGRKLEDWEIRERTRRKRETFRKSLEDSKRIEEDRKRRGDSNEANTRRSRKKN